MITENLSTLKIHKLTQEQYDRELAAGRIDENALYLTPDEYVDLSSLLQDQKEETSVLLEEKADKDHIHDAAGENTNGFMSASDKGKLDGIEEGATKVGQKTTDGGEIFNDYENNKALSENSHAEGNNVVASGKNQHVQGRFNIIDSSYAHIVGNGDETKLSNAHTLDWDGNAWFAGDVTVTTADGEVALGEKLKAVFDAIAQKTQVQIITWEEND